MLSRQNLRVYQNAGVSHIVDVMKGALWMSMGLGKTATVLTAIVDLFNSFEIRKVLIIAPKRVALHTWPSEIKNWEHTKDLTYSVLYGSPSERLDKLRQFTDIHIISRDSVQWLVKTLGQNWDYDMVVIDESSSFKNHQAKRFKELRKCYNKIDRMVQLTGTPAPNGLLDLWSQVYLLDQGERLGRTITSFRRAYFYPLKNFFGFKLRHPNCAEMIYKKLEDICFTIKHSDYLELPEVITTMVEVEMPPVAAKQYKALSKELLLEFESGAMVEAEFAAALQNKLLQICNGAVYITDEDDPTSKAFEVIHDAKLEALDSIIEESGGNPILCAYSYQSDKQRILDRYKGRVTLLDDDPATLDKWNRGEIPFLLTHPASAGHGLNLQHGGNILVWFGMQWNLEYYLQFNARLARPGQKADNVFMYQISTAGTIEHKVFNALNSKDMTQQELVDFMKKPLELFET